MSSSISGLVYLLGNQNDVLDLYLQIGVYLLGNQNDVLDLYLQIGAECRVHRLRQAVNHSLQTEHVHSRIVLCAEVEMDGTRIFAEGVREAEISYNEVNYLLLDRTALANRLVETLTSRHLQHVGDVFLEALELRGMFFERGNLVQSHVSCFCELRHLLVLLTELPLQLRPTLIRLAKFLSCLCLLLLVVLCHALPVLDLTRELFNASVVGLLDQLESELQLPVRRL